MTKSMYKYIGDFWKNRNTPEFKALMRQRIIQWRREGVAERVERPTRLDRARALGYKAKQGYTIVRAKVRRGGRRKKRPVRGRKSRNMGVNKITPKKSIKLIAEERVARKYSNLEVLNSYWVGQDGRHKFFEIILVDPQHPAIAKDPRTSWLSIREYRGDKTVYLKNPVHRGRVHRGLTSSGRKSRGLRNKGYGAEKIRPSLRSHGRRGN
ncbi:MAG: 50S ribosomal protein L15e [Candidatus Heimdallarchaeota archaeon]|nr:50S ribosomal protein L15e [Candidatus Heimdallarchaeota archaeon]